MLFGGTVNSVDNGKSERSSQRHQPQSNSLNDEDEDYEDCQSMAPTVPAMDEESAVRIDHGACVGCELGDTIEPVDQFVLSNVHRIPKTRLWTLAKDAYQTQVVEAVQRQGGGTMPEWTRVDIERHYEYHVVDPKLFRIGVLQELKGMRALCKQRMVMESPNGGQEIDTRSMKEYIQLLTMESKEYHLLTNTPLSCEGLFGNSTHSNSTSSKTKKSR